MTPGFKLDKRTLLESIANTPKRSNTAQSVKQVFNPSLGRFTNEGESIEQSEARRESHGYTDKEREEISDRQTFNMNIDKAKEDLDFMDSPKGKFQSKYKQKDDSGHIFMNEDDTINLSGNLIQDRDFYRELGKHRSEDWAKNREYESSNTGFGKGIDKISDEQGAYDAFMKMDPMGTNALKQGGGAVYNLYKSKKFDMGSRDKPGLDHEIANFYKKYGNTASDEDAAAWHGKDVETYLADKAAKEASRR